ncbi:hypothetical protein OKA05_01920 [Luteolibacter arcticus]|uniref:Uncharacterized protein n=1 Tax=Luteolibacter arcticus TaxID=1581411 RepID=A0ABT3GCL4_9BACT|nr:hypothetical protein [Luteolibacter arcticus]MCW1921289.1 hypothetical protein [Luteolibacter arcticus]
MNLNLGDRVHSYHSAHYNKRGAIIAIEFGGVIKVRLDDGNEFTCNRGDLETILPPAAGTTEGMSTGPEGPQHDKPMPPKSSADKAQPTGETIPEVIIAPENEVLILRTCTRNEAGQLVGYGGFPWPESGPVHAPESWNPAWGEKPYDFIGGFDPRISCGAGLHGLEEGNFDGDWNLLNWDIDAQAMLVVTDKTTLARVGCKVKFQSGIVRKLVSLAEGLCALFCQPKHINAEVARIAEEAKKDNDPAHPVEGNASRLAASGYASQLAASGYASQLAASGYASRLAASGNASQLAASGNASQLAASGNDSQLAASGYASRLAASGNDSIAVSAGLLSRAKAGTNGAIALAWHDGTRIRVAVGYVGENGIEADTWYQVSEAGELVKVD